MKTIQEQICIMQHYANFNDEVEQLYITTSSAISEKWNLKSSFPFDWQNYDYRIKEQKKTITIEKWLLKTKDKEIYWEYATNEIDKYILCNLGIEKIKLLESKEIEL